MEEKRRTESDLWFELFEMPRQSFVFRGLFLTNELGGKEERPYKMPASSGRDLSGCGSCFLHKPGLRAERWTAVANVGVCGLTCPRRSSKSELFLQSNNGGSRRQLFIRTDVLRL